MRKKSIFLLSIYKIKIKNYLWAICWKSKHFSSQDFWCSWKLWKISRCFFIYFLIGSFELLTVKWPAYFTFLKLCYWFWNDLYLEKQIKLQSWKKSPLRDKALFISFLVKLYVVLLFILDGGRIVGCQDHFTGSYILSILVSYCFNFGVDILQTEIR